ncbi:MAG: M14 family zinc carboxypeptidase [Planctomycetota bacterium]
MLRVKTIERISDINNKSSIALVLLIPFIILAATGCYKSVDHPVIVKVLPPPIPEQQNQRLIGGKSIENRPIVHTVLGKGSDVTFVLAAIHGNEKAGIQLVHRLEKYLQQNPNMLEKRRVVLLPIANPDGVARNSRYNARGIDLNRNFPAHNRINSNRFGRTALSEPEARFIFELIRKYNPDRIISIHQPLACIDYDGPSRALAYRMAEYCNLPLKKVGAKPGSLGSHAGVMLGIPVITLELPRSTDRYISERLWQQYGPALVAAVAYPHRAK